METAAQEAREGHRLEVTKTLDELTAVVAELEAARSSLQAAQSVTEKAQTIDAERVVEAANV